MEAIVAHIRTHNPKVRPYVEMTWGRRNGYTERKFDYDFLRSYASMQERIRVNTLAEAEAVGAAASGSGVAWSRVRTERPDIELYAADGSHPSYAGSYLAAAVICTTLTGAPFGAAPSDGLLDPRHGGLPAPRGGADRTGPRLTNGSGVPERSETPLPSPARLNGNRSARNRRSPPASKRRTSADGSIRRISIRIRSPSRS